MKKRIIGLLMVLCLALVLAAGCGPKNIIITPPEELIVNGGFETPNLDAWELIGGVTATIVDTEANSGTYSCQVSGITQNWNCVQQIVTDVLNENGPGTYHVEYYAKLASGSQPFMIMWGRTTVTGTQQQIDSSLQFDAFPESHPNITTEWTKVEADIDMSWSGTLTKAIIAFKQEDILPYATTVYIDDFSMKKK